MGTTRKLKKGISHLMVDATLGISRKVMQDQEDSQGGKWEVGTLPDFPEDRFKREIAERLRSALKLAGGPSKVSARSGISLRTLANYSSERSELKASALVRLAEACDVSLDWLATGRLPVHPVDRIMRFDADAGGEKVVLDEALLRDVLGALEGYLSANPAPSLTPAKKAGVATTAYTLAIEGERELATAEQTIARLVRLATL